VSGPPVRIGLLAILLLAACGSAGAVASPPPAGEASTPAVAATPIARAVARGPELLARAEPLLRPPQPAMAVRYEAALLADHCMDRDLVAPPAVDVVMTVLDRSYALPPGYVPDDLVAASAAGPTGSSGTKLVRSVLVDDLSDMHAAWQAAGLSVLVESGYRSYGAQAATFDSWAARLGYAEALVRSARPGHSEHQLGTSIDLSSPGWGGRFGDWGRETAEGAWMAAHAWEYGFVMSYPSGSQAHTCFSYEPWHYRWIGREAAAAHRASGLYLRHFLERYIDD
jgi:D-alanyl-D-alanine carboxypeptidase